MARKHEDIELFHGYGLHIPTRTIFMGSESSSDMAIETGGESGTDHTMAEKVIKNLHILTRLSNDPITIIMDNVGGDVYRGIAIYDAIRACTCEVTIVVRGHAMSMGAYVLQGADRRVLAPGSKVMIHYGQISISGEALTVYKWIEEYKKEDRKMEKVLLEKIQEKQPHFTLQRLKRMLSNDTIFSAEEAIGMGLADEIGDRYE